MRASYPYPRRRPAGPVCWLCALAVPLCCALAMPNTSYRRLARLLSQLPAVAATTTSGGQAEEPMVLADTRGRVRILTLNRPRALNALCDQLTAELQAHLDEAVADVGVGAIVITGAGRAFAAGADVTELAERTLPMMVHKTFPGPAWSAVAKCPLPTIAAVNGLALGGGCELAMMCDIVVAGEKAQFGQPEIKLGIIPGAGGTQRLTKAVGKSKAMELALTGDTIGAAEAASYNLVSQVVPTEEVLEAALSLAGRIASLSRPAVILAKESVLASMETTLEAGLAVERKIFHSCFALADGQEGMSAFVNKRKPVWSHS